MRTIIDLGDVQLEALDALCRSEGISRAEAVRRAVDQHVKHARAAAPDPAFGLWRGVAESGLDYERRLRREWDGAPGPTRPARRGRR